MNDSKIKVAGYVRVSTGVQAVDGESLENQKNQIKDYCHFKKWELTEIYEDAGISGSKAERRPGFLRMILDAENKKFNVVLFTKFSRFARNARDYYNYQFKLEKCNVTLSSIKENIDPTTHNGRLMAGIFALLADWEREMIKEQMAENKIVKWREKRMFNGSPPYGYIWDKNEAIFKENKEESIILNRIFKMYVENNISMKDITLKLNAEGSRSRRSKWSSSTISGIFKNKCYLDCKLVNNTKVYIDGIRTNELKDESEWIVYDLPLIIEKSLCEKVERRREFNIKKQKRTTWQENFWLRDSLKCMSCNGKLRAKKGSERNDETFPRYYICHWGTCSDKDLKIDNRERCIKTHLNADNLEEYVWDTLTFSLTGNPILDNGTDEEVLRKESEKRFSEIFGENLEGRISDIDNKINGLSNELDKKIRLKNNLIRMLEDDDLILESLNVNLKDSLREIAYIKEQILASQNEILELERLQNRKKEYIDNCDSLFDLWNDLQELSPQDKKRLVESVIPGGVSVLPAKNMLGPSTVVFNIEWNDSIFELLQGEGKLPSLGTNGSDYSP